jgi:hypothetical protein
MGAPKIYTWSSINLGQWKFERKFGVWFPCECASIAISFENNGIWMLILSVNPPHTRKHKRLSIYFETLNWCILGVSYVRDWKRQLARQKKNKNHPLEKEHKFISSKWTQKEIVHHKFDHYYYVDLFFQFCDIRNFGEFSNKIAKVVEFYTQKKTTKFVRKKFTRLTRSFLQVFGSSHG